MIADKAPKAPRLVCEHCGRSGSPKTALRVIGLRLSHSACDISDIAMAASDAGALGLAQQLGELVSLLDATSLRLLGIDEQATAESIGGPDAH